MICARCKNEKWDQDICPKCGLGEKDALLDTAENYRKEGKNGSAVSFYEKFLLLDPENLVVMERMGICLCSEAGSHQDESLFVKAERALNMVLQENWSWEKGHQARIELYFSFGRIDGLLEEYSKISNEKDFRAPLCFNLIEIIKLAKKFKENPPPSFLSADQKNKSLFLKSFWPLFVGVPLLLWAVYEISSLPHAREEGNGVILLFVFLFIVLSIIMLIYLCMRMYKRNQADKKEVSELVEPN